MKALTEQPAKAASKRLMQLKHADTMRVFFALWPEPAIQHKLHAVAKKYRAACNARIMHTETLHMTLQFIGNIKRTQLSKLIKAADKIADTTPFQFNLDTLSFWKHNRIGYATSSTSVPALDKLVATLQQELDKENVVLDSTKFTPHLTLFRNVEQSLAPQIFTPVAWQVNSFALMESITTSQKTEYRILREWPLAAPNTPQG